MVASFSDNYSAIAKECCGDWKTNPSFSLAKCSKLCSKFSVEFKHLHSVILCITNQEMSRFVHRQAVRRLKLPVSSPLHPEIVKKLALFIKNFYTMISIFRYYKIVAVLDTVSGINERTLLTDCTQKLTIEGKDLD